MEHTCNRNSEPCEECYAIMDARANGVGRWQAHEEELKQFFADLSEFSDYQSLVKTLSV